MSPIASSTFLAPKAWVPNQRAILFVIAMTLATVGSLAWKAWDSLANERRAFGSELLLQSQA